MLKAMPRLAASCSSSKLYVQRAALQKVDGDQCRPEIKQGEMVYHAHAEHVAVEAIAARVQRRDGHTPIFQHRVAVENAYLPLGLIDQESPAADRRRHLAEIVDTRRRIRQLNTARGHLTGLHLTAGPSGSRLMERGEEPLVRGQVVEQFQRRTAAAKFDLRMILGQLPVEGDGVVEQPLPRQQTGAGVQGTGGELRAVRLFLQCDQFSFRRHCQPSVGRG